MGFLDRAVKRAVGNAVGNAVGSAVEQGVRKAVAPKIEQATTNAVNSAATKFNQSVGTAQQAPYQTAQPIQSSVNQVQAQQAAATLGGIFGSYTGAVQNFANEAAKNMKICPSCGASAKAEVKFCPSCGGKMPEQTVAQGAVCTACGKQNVIGTKFCADCGAKLPAALAEEQAAQQKDAAAMSQWDSLLSYYPKWCCGGTEYNLENYDGNIMFSARFPNGMTANSAVNQYRSFLQQNGFRQAGQYPSVNHLYKMVNGVCCHVDTEHCFEGDSNCPSLYFDYSEPTGGFNYVKPEPARAKGFKDFFNF